MTLDGLDRCAPCSVLPLDRLAVARDTWPKRTLGLTSGILPPLPCAVAWPESEEQVLACLQWATDRRVPVVPYGAGSGVCGAAEGRSDALTLDLKRLRRIHRVDVDCRTVRVQAGVIGQHLEDSLEQQGWATRHSPSSIWCSTVGGWAAGRSAGQFSSKYGKFEDMLVAGRVVAPTGGFGIGAWAVDEDAGPYVVGSEGALGVFTEVEVRVVPFPRQHRLRGYRFPSVEQALLAMRCVLQSELHPSVLRLYDPADTRIAGKGTATKDKAESWLAGLGRRIEAVPALRHHLLSLPLAFPRLLNALVDRVSGACILITGWEGDGPVVDILADEGHRIVMRAGAEDLGVAPGEHWYRHRHEVSYKLAPIFARGGFADTMEVAALWSRVPELYARVRSAISKYGIVMAHFSHGYREGCSIYFTFAAVGSGSVYDALWTDALAAAADAGATVAHHHGVGQLKQAAAGRELAGIAPAFQALKHRLDPAGILNPGRMFPDAPAEDAIAPALGVDPVSQVATIDAQALASDRDRALAEAGWELRHPTPDAIATTVSGPRWPWESRVLGCSVRVDGRLVVLRPVPRSSAGPDPRAHFPPGSYETVTVPILPLADAAVRCVVSPEDLVRADLRPARTVAGVAEFRGPVASALASLAVRE